MTRLIVVVLSALAGVVIGLVAGAALGIRAQTEPTEETVALAEQAGIDPIDLLGALHTTGLDAVAYLRAVGHLEPPPPSSLREYAYATYLSLAPCIERIVQVESNGWVTHGWNPVPWGRWGEHASGLGGFLPSTWATTPEGRTGGSIWDGYAQVRAIAWMLSVGRGREFAAVQWGRC